MPIIYVDFQDFVPSFFLVGSWGMKNNIKIELRSVTGQTLKLQNQLATQKWRLIYLRMCFLFFCIFFSVFCYSLDLGKK